MNETVAVGVRTGFGDALPSVQNRASRFGSARKTLYGTAVGITLPLAP